ncbi:MAG: TetR family transcriptional regulator [Streptosporangiales bacterium]|nr:TetR family transcriptional regulator [Streptosporangiales bacterium]
MTKLGDRPSSTRGSRRREEIVRAGVDLLVEAGWPAVTTRRVAARAGVNVGLIHYHFGGLAQLRAAITQRAAEDLGDPVVHELLGADGARAVVDAMRRLLPETADDERRARLAMEVMAGALREPGLAAAGEDQLRQLRAALADRLGELYPDWPAPRRTGAATLLLALLEGLVLHRLLDPQLPVDEAMDALGALAERADDGRG